MSAVAEVIPAVDTLPRGTIDLRAFAADLSSGEASHETGDAWFSARRLLRHEGVVSIGVLTLGGDGHVAVLPADEFVFVLSGGLTIAGVATQTLAPDCGAMLPQGMGFSWTAEPGTQAIVMRYDGAGGGAEQMVLVDYDATLVPSNPPAAELLLSAAPLCRNHTDYVSPNGEFMCGIWDSTPYHRQHIDYRHCELMHLLSGSVTFEDEQGVSHNFRKDDLFVVLQGARCAWLSVEDCSKLWVIYRPAA